MPKATFNIELADSAKPICLQGLNQSIRYIGFLVWHCYVWEKQEGHKALLTWHIWGRSNDVTWSIDCFPYELNL